MRTSTAIAAFLLAGIAWSGAMAVEKPPKGRTAYEQGPFYDPRTGSYFELRLNRVRNLYWRIARKEAASVTYKGRRGRLAVVKDQETLDFIREHFRINGATWIGLQFYCKYRKLMWVTGELQPLGGTTMWAPRWYRNPENRCVTSNMAAMPVYLTPEADGPVLWQASSRNKTFRSFLVEYPARPAEAKTPDQDSGNQD